MAEIGTAKVRVGAVPDHALRREALDQAIRFHTSTHASANNSGGEDVVETAELFREFLNGESEFDAGEPKITVTNHVVTGDHKRCCARVSEELANALKQVL